MTNENTKDVCSIVRKSNVRNSVFVRYNLLFILNELEFAKISDVSNPDRQKGWSCKPIQHRDISDSSLLIFF
jgi:hypothetical protein